MDELLEDAQKLRVALRHLLQHVQSGYTVDELTHEYVQEILDSTAYLHEEK